MAWLEMAIACRRDGRVSEVFIRRLARMARGSAHDMSRRACNFDPGTRMHFLARLTSTGRKRCRTRRSDFASVAWAEFRG